MTSFLTPRQPWPDWPSVQPHLRSPTLQAFPLEEASFTTQMFTERQMSVSKVT